MPKRIELISESTKKKFGDFDLVLKYMKDLDINEQIKTLKLYIDLSTSVELRDASIAALNDMGVVFGYLPTLNELQAWAPGNDPDAIPLMVRLPQNSRRGQEVQIFLPNSQERIYIVHPQELAAGDNLLMQYLGIMPTQSIPTQSIPTQSISDSQVQLVQRNSPHSSHSPPRFRHRHTGGRKSRKGRKGTKTKLHKRHSYNRKSRK